MVVVFIYFCEFVIKKMVIKLCCGVDPVAIMIQIIVIVFVVTFAVHVNFCVGRGMCCCSVCYR